MAQEGGFKMSRRGCCNNNFDVCTIIPLLIILSKTGVLADNNAFVLLLLFWLCGGVEANALCGCRGRRRRCC